MYLTEISLTNFRSYREATVTAPPGLVLIVGPNGAGKTNLLEAIHFLAICRSFRPSADRDLVRAGERGLAVRATARGRAGDQTLELTYDAAAGKRAVVNGEEMSRLVDYVGTLPTVSFSPEDLALVKGEPAFRRRFLDTWLGQQHRDYLYFLQRYQETLRRRNVLLATQAPPSAREPFDVELVNTGAALTCYRADAVAALAPAAAAAYASLAPKEERFAVAYLPSVENATPERDALRRAFADLLAAGAAEEKRRGQTLVGPHRDDLGLAVNGADARRFASEGQQRTAALALRLAQTRLLKERRGEAPLILLDDVASELDEGRQRRLFAALADAEQTWLTATEAPPGFKPDAKYRIAYSKLTREV